MFACTYRSTFIFNSQAGKILTKHVNAKIVSDDIQGSERREGDQYVHGSVPLSANGLASYHQCSILFQLVSYFQFTHTHTHNLAEN